MRVGSYTLTLGGVEIREPFEIVEATVEAMLLKFPSIGGNFIWITSSKADFIPSCE